MEADERECPYCAEVIKAKARKCRFCQSEITPLIPPTEPLPGADNAPGPAEIPGAVPPPKPLEESVEVKAAISGSQVREAGAATPPPPPPPAPEPAAGPRRDSAGTYITVQSPTPAPAPGLSRGPIIAMWVCVACAWFMFLTPLPFISIVAWAVNLAAFILAIVCLARSVILHGILGIVCSTLGSIIMYLVGMSLMLGVGIWSIVDGLDNAARSGRPISQSVGSTPRRGGLDSRGLPHGMTEREARALEAKILGEMEADRRDSEIRSKLADERQEEHDRQRRAEFEAMKRELEPKLAEAFQRGNAYIGEWKRAGESGEVGFLFDQNTGDTVSGVCFDPVDFTRRKKFSGAVRIEMGKVWPVSVGMESAGVSAREAVNRTSLVWLQADAAYSLSLTAAGEAGVVGQNGSGMEVRLRPLSRSNYQALNRKNEERIRKWRERILDSVAPGTAYSGTWRKGGNSGKLDMEFSQLDRQSGKVKGFFCDPDHPGDKKEFAGSVSLAEGGDFQIQLQVAREGRVVRKSEKKSKTQDHFIIVSIDYKAALALDGDGLKGQARFIDVVFRRKAGGRSGGRSSSVPAGGQGEKAAYAAAPSSSSVPSAAPARASSGDEEALYAAATDASGYEAYLRRFPNGPHALEIRNKLERSQFALDGTWHVTLYEGVNQGMEYYTVISIENGRHVWREIPGSYSSFGGYRLPDSVREEQVTGIVRYGYTNGILDIHFDGEENSCRFSPLSDGSLEHYHEGQRMTIRKVI